MTFKKKYLKGKIKIFLLIIQSVSEILSFFCRYDLERIDSLSSRETAIHFRTNDTAWKNNITIRQSHITTVCSSVDK